MMNVNKFRLIIIATLLCTIFTGCSCEHNIQKATCDTPEYCDKCGEEFSGTLEHIWEPATCKNPKTCELCNKEGGDTLEHTWIEATCTTAKMCDACSLIEGESLGHIATKADYQNPSTCETCSIQLSDKLDPEFEVMEVKGSFMELNKFYNYVASTSNIECNTVASMKISKYVTYESNSTHEAKEGYEWKLVRYVIEFNDENANEYGMNIGTCSEDYYSTSKHDDEIVYDEEGWGTFTVYWDGQEYTECRSLNTGFYDGWKDNSNVYMGTAEFLVPVGYDGMVIGFYNRNNIWAENMYIYDVADDDTLFFRLD